MSEAMKPLVDLMNRTDKVRLTARGTDLTFSIRDIPAIACDGQMNIPDGEVYTAPVRDSINGVITYNTPSICQGTTFENVCLEFENGKIVKLSLLHISPVLSYHFRYPDVPLPDLYGHRQGSGGESGTDRGH